MVFVRLAEHRGEILFSFVARPGYVVISDKRVIGFVNPSVELFLERCQLVDRAVVREVARQDGKLPPADSDGIGVVPFVKDFFSMALSTAPL